MVGGRTSSRSRNARNANRDDPQATNTGDPTTPTERHPADEQEIKERLQDVIRVLRQSDSDIPGRDEAIIALEDTSEDLEAKNAKTAALEIELQHQSEALQHQSEALQQQKDIIAQLTAKNAKHEKESNNQKAYITTLEARTPYLNEKIDTLLKAVERLIAEKSQPSNTKNPSPLYSSVLVGTAKTIPPTVKSTITAELKSGTKGKTAAEILAEVRTVYKEAIAAEPLPSGDARLTFPNPEQKDRAMNQTPHEDINIRKESHFVAVDGVPITLKIGHGRNTNNDEVIKQLKSANFSLHPELNPHGIRWLDNRRKYQNKVDMGQRRTTIILALPTEAVQEAVVRYGLALDGVMYDARLYHRKAMPQQCYQCYRWGHSHTHCTDRVTCGKCAGGHPSALCESEALRCINCARPHCAWQRSQCKVADRVQREAEAIRHHLNIRTAAIRGVPAQARVYQPPVRDAFTLQPPENGWTIQNRRKRQLSPDPTQTYGPTGKRGPGRPRSLYSAAALVGQTRIHLRSTSSAAPVAPRPTVEDFPMTQ